jgi:hypothetical protein
MTRHRSFKDVKKTLKISIRHMQTATAEMPIADFGSKCGGQRRHLRSAQNDNLRKRLILRH